MTSPATPRKLSATLWVFASLVLAGCSHTMNLSQPSSSFLGEEMFVDRDLDPVEIRFSGVNDQRPEKSTTFGAGSSTSFVAAEPPPNSLASAIEFNLRRKGFTVAKGAASAADSKLLIVNLDVSLFGFDYNGGYAGMSSAYSSEMVVSASAKVSDRKGGQLSREKVEAILPYAEEGGKMTWEKHRNHVRSAVDYVALKTVLLVLAAQANLAKELAADSSLENLGLTKASISKLQKAGRAYADELEQIEMRTNSQVRSGQARSQQRATQTEALQSLGQGLQDLTGKLAK